MERGRIIDGKAIAAKVRLECAARAAKFKERTGRAPGLHVVLVGDDAASQVYVRNKERAAKEAGFAGEVHRLPGDTSEARVLSLIKDLNVDSRVDGILVQLPVPAALDGGRLVAALDPAKDVDGLHIENQGRLFAGRAGLRPCTPLGSMRLLDEIGAELAGARAVVVGRSALVGKPMAMMLLERNATVTMAHSRTTDLAATIHSADIVVAAVGRAELIRGDWIRDGAVVIDVGINRGTDGLLRGDVHFESAKQRAAWITPVPGGVGAMTVAMLLANTIAAAEARR